MKITAIRIRKLVSRERGYGHDAAEIEAAVEDGDNPEDVAATLHNMVDAQIRAGSREAHLRETMEQLYENIHGLERRRDIVNQELADQNAAIRKNDALIKLGKKHGIDVTEAENATMPF